MTIPTKGIIITLTETTSTATQYIVPFDGLITGVDNLLASASVFYVNDVDVVHFGAATSTGIGISIPVKKGDRLRIYNSGNRYTHRFLLSPF